MAQKGVYSGGMHGRLWEGGTSKGWGYILGGRSRFWEGRIDFGSVTYNCRKGEEWGRLWESRIGYSCQK